MVVNVVDAVQVELVDPITALPAYPDTTKPQIGEVYLLDELARRQTTLQSGGLDVIATAFDRDDSSPRNLEVASVAFIATDQLGNVLGRLTRCRLADAFTKLATDWMTASSTIRLIDFGSATGQLAGFWPSSDLGNPDRLFRYALTNLRNAQDGSCSVVDNDRDGQLAITDDVTSLTLTIDMWDSRDNQQTAHVTVNR
jgi:hypothetical protein